MYEKKWLGLKYRFKEFLVNSEAVSGTEYAIMLAMIVLGSMAVIQMIGEDVESSYENLYEPLNDVDM